MSWSAPRTWVAGEAPSAAVMNSHIRDNLLASEAATLTTAGDLAYATGANALTRLARGTTAQHLKVASGVPVWATVASTHPLISGQTSLTDVTAGYSASTWTQWGTEEAAITDPEVNVDLVGFLHGTVSNAADPTTAVTVSLRLSLSVDGGSTWADGTSRGSGLDVDVTSGKNTIPGSSVHSWLNQNPTAQIQLRGWFYSTTTTVDFTDGQLLLLAVKL